MNNGSGDVEMSVAPTEFLKDYLSGRDKVLSDIKKIGIRPARRVWLKGNPDKLNPKTSNDYYRAKGVLDALVENL